MHVSQLSTAVGHHDALTGIVEGVLGSAGSVLLSGAAGTGKTAILDAVAAQLALSPARVVRVNASGAAESLPLRGFLAQVAGLQDPDDLTDDDLVRAFEVLTVPDRDRRDGIVLLLDGAEALLPEALRYVQLACKLQPLLQVVFAARPAFGERLEDGELAFLRGRLARTFMLRRPGEAAGGAIAGGLGLGATVAADEGVARVPPSNPGQPSSASLRRRRLWRPPAWAMVWMALIAEVALGTAFLMRTAPEQPDQFAAAGTAPGAGAKPSPVALAASPAPTPAAPERQVAVATPSVPQIPEVPSAPAPGQARVAESQAPDAAPLPEPVAVAALPAPPVVLPAPASNIPDPAITRPRAPGGRTHAGRRSPHLAAPGSPVQVYSGRRPGSGYIGVYVTGADGVRVFRTAP